MQKMEKVKQVIITFSHLLVSVTIRSKGEYMYNIKAYLKVLNIVTVCFSFLFHSDTAPLHPCGPGLSHSALLCGRPFRGHHDSRWRGHHVCAED